MKPDVVERKLDVLQNIGILLIIGGMVADVYFKRLLTANLLLAFGGALVVVPGIVKAWRRAEKDE